jgi:cysteine desulfurase / selenocysteine lyase
MLKLENTMSTNIDQTGFPDAKILEALANEYFKADTITSQSEAGKDLLKYDVLSEQPQAPVQLKPPISVGGIGASAGAINPINVIDLRNQDQDFSNSQFPGTANLSPSVAGSGISPLAHKQGNEVDLQNPQTALADPHFAGNSNVPQSVAGSGISPSVKYAQQYEALPLTNEQDLLPGIKNILAGIPSFINTSQIPHTKPGVNNEFYYFLQENNFPSSPGKNLNTNKGAEENKTGLTKPPFDVNLIKKDFPILQETVNGKPLIWLDNAATTQKPKQVIDRVRYFYEHENSNIHRAAHELAARATDAYEGAREKVRRFLNAASANEIIFVRGTTEAINLVAKTYGDQYLQKGDEIIISHLEHHANIVPWQQLAQKKGLKLRVIPVDDNGQIQLDEYRKLLNPKTKLVSFTQVSNALGTVTPAKQVIDMAHANGAKVLLDGAQSVSHMRVDLQLLNPDFFVFSGHKIFGPTGIGVIYGREELLNSLQPWQGGGNMIKDVTFEHTQFHDAPSRFEAGTGNIADAVGLGAALDYVNKLGIDNINQYEHYLLYYATSLMKQVPGLRLIGTAADKASVLSFTLKGYSNDEVGKALNKEGIAVRTGHHCAQPILRRFGVESTVRPSLAFYNTCGDIDTLVSVLHHLKNK